MTPDLPTQVREAFEATHRPSFWAGKDELDAALAAVIAVVQEDRTRAIVEWTRDHTAFPTRKRDDMPHDPLMLGVAVEMWRAGDRIEAKFGGTTHD